MKILMITKYPPIQGGVSAQNYWLANSFAELGHEVVVVTNAEEVEEHYRIEMSGSDYELLAGFRKSNSIKLFSTKMDKRQKFIPQSNPFLTKLTSLTLDVIASWGPDFIYSHYVEPYGIAALFASKLTNIPYVIKHAGSDLGNLGKNPQMKTLHENVYRNAMFVLTSSRHFEYFRSIGIDQEKLKVLGYSPLAPDVFFPSSLGELKGKIKLISYGKTGTSKGTFELIEAMDKIREFAQLEAYWGGIGIDSCVKKLNDVGLIQDETVKVNGFIPHWRIAEKIRNSDVALYLENNFSISIHTPGIPFEVLSCGRPLITTREIADKYPNLITPKNSIVIEDERLSAKSVAEAIMEARIKLSCAGFQTQSLDNSEMFSNGITKVERFLNEIKTLIP